MKKFEEHDQSNAKAHTGKVHKPHGRVMPSVRDAKNDAGQLDPATIIAHLPAIVSSVQQGEYTPDTTDGNDGTNMTAAQVQAAAALGVHAQEGWDWLIITGKRHS